MSSQDQNGIPLFINRDQQNFRLMELPPDLADMLNGNNPPILRLGSSDSNASDDSSDANLSPVVLTAGDKVYQIRQVSTSNSVFLLQPSATPSEGDGAPGPGLAAVATIGSTLELLPGTSGPTTSRKWHEKFKRVAK